MKQRLFPFFLILILTHLLKSVDIGSDTAVERFNTQQQLANGDRIAGFSAIAGGFALDGSGVTATWDSFFPASGDFEFANGTVILNLDLIFHNVSSFRTLGNIIGNCHVLELSPKMGCVPESTPACIVSFLVEETQVEPVNSVEWSFDSEYVVIGKDQGIGDELEVYSWDGTTLTLEDGAEFGAHDVFGVAWHPTNDWIAVARDSGTGDEIYTYTFDRSAGTLALIDSISLGGGGNNGAFAVEWHPDGDHVAFATAVSGAQVRVYEVDSAGMFGAVTTANITVDVNSVRWDIDGTYLAIGTNNIGGGDEVQVFEFTAAPLGLTFNASFNTGDIVNEVAWCKAADNSDILAYAVQSGTNRVELLRHDGGAGTLTLITGRPAGTNAISVDFNPGCECLAAGVAKNNEGTGGELRTYQFFADTLTLEDDAELNQDVLSVRWSPNGKYLALGTDDTGGETPGVAIYRLDSEFSELNSVTFSDLQLFMNCNITMKDVIVTFTGDSILNGQGNILTMAPGFIMKVESGANLLMKHVKVAGVSGSNIVGVDETSTFSLQDVTWALSDDYTFTTGRIDVVEEFRIEGDGNTFIWQSDAPLTVKGGLNIDADDDCNTKGYCGCLVVDHGVTFSYDVQDPNLLVLENEMSKMVMNSATLAATTTLQLTTGILQIEGKSFFESGESIIFGNCTEAGNLCVELLPAANLCVTSGDLTYNNV